MEQFKTKVKYRASGYIMGNLWSGGKGIYPAKTVEAENEEELKDIINGMIEDKTLDSGMGFESLVGAGLNITKIEKIKVNDRWYTHKYKPEFNLFGNMTMQDESEVMDVIIHSGF